MLLTRRYFLRRTSQAVGTFGLLGLVSKADAGCTIVSRTVSSVVDKRIQISNSGFVRSIGSMSSAVRMRVGIRFNVVDTGGDLTSPAVYLFLGFCNGTTNVFWSADAATNVIGATLNCNCLRSTDIGTHYHSDYPNGGLGLVGQTQVGAGQTQTPFSTPAPFALGAQSDMRTALFIDVKKSTPNYPVGYFKWDGSVAVDVSKDDFMTQMAASTPALTGHSYQTPDAYGAFSEATYPMNAVNVFWNHASALMEICDLAVATFDT